MHPNINLSPVTEEYQGKRICDMTDEELKNAINQIGNNHQAIKETISSKIDDFLPFVWFNEIGLLVIEPLFLLLLKEWVRRRLISANS